MVGTHLFTAPLLSTLVAAQGYTPPDPALQTREARFYRITDLVLSNSASASRDTNWQPGDDRVLEISGLDRLPDGRILACTRRGDVWRIGGIGTGELRYEKFATALHEPLGVLAHGGAVFAVQRTELTRLVDTNGDGRADEYLAFAKGWNVSGNYHEYAFGPKRDGRGRLWLTLNIGIGKGSDSAGAWRGWGLTVDASGKLTPMCAGMRSPSGIGINAAGDAFYTDQQGDWIPTCPLHHLRAGVFFGNAQALPTFAHEDAPFRLSGKIPVGEPYPEAVRRLPELVPPAVWMPYHKAGESSTDIVRDDSRGRFGPFADQLFVGDFRSALITRVFLEKVGGEYQGAVFPFRRGFASAVVRMCMDGAGGMVVGLTNRGWTSVGAASYGLQRMTWTGEVPFEIHAMRARPDGFELTFTKPVDRTTAAAVASYRLASFTYRYHARYGSPEILREDLSIRSATVAAEGRSVRLRVKGLRPMFVHELRAQGLRAASGESLLHPDAYYTLNRIPER